MTTMPKPVSSFETRGAKDADPAIAAVEQLANVQTQEPKSHAYDLKNPIHKHVGMMKAGFSQVAR